MVSYIAHVGWLDVVDILLNSYILFRFYILFRGTTAIRVLLGILVLWFFQRIAFSLGLVLTSWVLQGVTAAAALVIIVVFRNEIRSVLQTRNLKAVLWGNPQKIPNTPVEIIADSTFALARQRVGALIVLPGRNDISELVHGGVPWGGQISKEMLLSIFWPDNPVHDGAAVVSGDRITRAAVVLPLSQRDDMPFYYGTRHRAAAGLSERSDAVVIIVSEERGVVSVAREGRLQTIDRSEDLLRILQEHLSGQKVGPGLYRREKTELVTAAAACCVLVGLAWFGFVRGSDTLMSMDVPVTFTLGDAGMQIVDTSADRVQVHVRGSGALIKSLRPDSLQVRVDLRRSESGSLTVPITDNEIQLPPGVRLRKVEPQEITLTLDRLVQKTLPLQVDWTGSLPDDRVVTRAVLAPASIVVRGSSQSFSGVSTIYTEPISLASLAQSGTLDARIALPPRVSAVKPAPGATVQVSYTVAPRPSSAEKP